MSSSFTAYTRIIGFFFFLAKQNEALSRVQDFSPHLLNPHTEAILLEQEYLPGFIIDEHEFNITGYANETVLTANLEWKLREIQANIANERTKKELLTEKKKTLYDRQ